MSKEDFAYTVDENRRYIAVVVYKDKKASINQYKVENNKSLHLDIPKDTQFVISLPANSTITYTWNIKNEMDSNYIKYLGKTKMHIPTPKAKEKSEGLDYDRENLSFKLVKTGNAEMVLKYESKVRQSDDFFQITLNIN